VIRKYLFAIEIDPVKEGEVYNRLPLHCTLMHWFLSEKAPEEIAAAVSEALQKQPSVELVSVEPALFGPNNDVPVHLLAKSESFTLLHMNLIGVLIVLDVQFTASQYVGSKYRPHVTIIGEHSFPVGSRKKAERIFLAESLDDKMPSNKKMQAVITLR
jgi:2'-5' RNA ligase